MLYAFFRLGRNLLVGSGLFLLCIGVVPSGMAESSYAFATEVNSVHEQHDLVPASDNYLPSVNTLKLVGEGSMRWLFFNLYDASFYSHSGTYQSESYPQALHLRYKKKIAAKHLLSATEKELKRIHGSKPEFALWLRELEKFWPNIDSGDALTLYVDKFGHSVFIQEDKLIGRISDRNFSRHFLSIWLSEDTRDSKLRQRLLGLR